MFQPDTNVRLLNTPLEPGYTDTLWFPDITSQTQYFLNHTVTELADFQYTKKNENIITVAGVPEQFYNINYVMYQNNNYSGKWFYAFIVDVVWASMGSVHLVCQTDCIQTWFFDITYYQSFIARQHSTTDVAGDNIVPEPIAGSRLIYDEQANVDVSPDTFIICATSDATGNPLGGEVYKNTYSGAAIRQYKGVAEVNNELANYVSNGLAQAVVSVQFMHTSAGQFFLSKYPNTIDGYTPKNNKLKTGAFLTCYVLGMGQELEFNADCCSGSTATITVNNNAQNGFLAVGVKNYGVGHTGNESFNASPMAMTLKYPEGTWAYNQYTNDYNLHSGSNAIYQERLKYERGYYGIEQTLRGAEGIVRAAGSVGAFNPLGDNFGDFSPLLSGASQTLEAFKTGTTYDKGIDATTQELTSIAESLRGPLVGGSPTSNAYMSLEYLTLSWGHKVPPADIAKRYDDYLTMYGYAQNDFAIPNLHARQNFTYIQVPNLIASGEFPGSDMTEIRSAFSRGIHFWASTARFGDFTQDNGVLGG